MVSSRVIECIHKFDAPAKCVSTLVRYGQPLSLLTSVLLSSRALKIILPNVPYRCACEYIGVPLLSDRRELLCFKLSDAMKDQKYKLHDLLPLKHETIYSLPKKVPFTKVPHRWLQK